MPARRTVKTGVWLAFISVIALLERTLLYLFYPPVIYHDTGGYQRSAQAILHGWGAYDGVRTPGYPLFWAIFGTERQVYLAQLVFGFLTTLLFFYLGWRVTGKGWAGAVAALAYTLNFQQLFFEANLLSETLTIFCLILALAGLAWLVFSNGRQPVIQILAAALTVGLGNGAALLIRPLYVFLPLLAGLFLVVFWRVRPAIRWGAALAASLTALVILLAWMNFIHKKFGDWDMSILTGYQLTQHTGPFFEHVPDTYAAIRETFIKYRDERIAATGSPADAIWYAIPDLQKVSGLGFYPLSKLMAQISYQLILSHPLLYLRSVAQSWLWFWKASIFWMPAQIPKPALGFILRTLALGEQAGMWACNLAFILGSIAMLWKRTRQTLQPTPFMFFGMLIIWITSGLQALLDHSDNLRQSIPIQTILILIVLWWIITLWHGRTKGKER